MPYTCIIPHIPVHTHQYNHVHTYSDSSNATSIQYLSNNRSLPIYSHQTELRTSSLHTVQAILDCPADLLCSSHPTNVSINCAFVVDTSRLRDIKCDDFGVWKQTKTATNHLKLTFDNRKFSPEYPIQIKEVLYFNSEALYLQIISRFIASHIYSY